VAVAKKQTRVHTLARELGVSSRDIVDKCKAEGIPNVDSHQSAVTVGLAATIREWFSAGATASTTAVEESAPIDVEAVKERAAATKKRKATKKGAGESDSVGATATLIEEPPARATGHTPAVVDLEHVPAAPTSAPSQGHRAAPEARPAASAAPTAEPQATVVSPVAPAAIAPAATPTLATKKQESTRAASAPAAAAPSASETSRDSGMSGEGGTGGEPAAPPASVAPTPAAPRPRAAPPIMNQPRRPDVVTPVGPKLQKPTQTKLVGPRVIRIEQPDPVAPPRPRGRGPDAAPGAPGLPGTDAGRGGVGGRGRVDRGRTGTADEESRAGPGGAKAGRRRDPRIESGRSGTAGPGDGAARAFDWRAQDLLEREDRLKHSGGFLNRVRRDTGKLSKPSGHRAVTAAQGGGKVEMTEPITIKGLSAATGVKTGDIISWLVRSGKPLLAPDAVLATELAVECMLERGIELDVTEAKSAEEQIASDFERRERKDERARPPVVTILGHVDHGKTTLLDRIRNANVAAGEAGGITQATSAFRVPVRIGEDDRTITFIDTPGHEAFTEMRSRGAKVTDLAVLVVAADDGVMPQTIESINHAKAAGVPIVVALNKIDKPEATTGNITRILGQLAEHGLQAVEWGGTTEVVKVSALKSQGITDLLEILDYQAQLLELKADFAGQAEGTVLEAQIIEGRGAVARILVQEGKLCRGDFVVVGRAFGRVRDIVDDRGTRLNDALPSTPVAISGIDELPDAGDKFYVVKSLKEAEAAALERRSEDRAKSLVTEKVTLDNIFDKIKSSGRKELPLVVKADVHGSIETLRVLLPKIGSGGEVTIAVKHSAVGGVNESDVRLAETTGAIVIGFNVTASSAARRLADQLGVDIRFYDVIYDLTDDVKKAAEGLLEPEVKLEVLGHAEVREVFKITKVGSIAGCYVTNGTIERNAQIRVTRGGIVVEKDRRLEQLKRFKDDVKEVTAGQECGMRIDGYDDIHAGDVLECYRMREIRRTL